MQLRCIHPELDQVTALMQDLLTGDNNELRALVKYLFSDDLEAESRKDPGLQQYRRV